MSKLKKIFYVVVALLLAFSISSCSSETETTATLRSGVSLGMTRAEVISAEAKNGLLITDTDPALNYFFVMDGVYIADIPVYMLDYFKDDRLIYEIYDFPYFDDTSYAYELICKKITEIFGEPKKTMEISLDDTNSFRHYMLHEFFAYIEGDRNREDNYTSNPKFSYWEFSNMTVVLSCCNKTFQVRIMSPDSEYLDWLHGFSKSDTTHSTEIENSFYDRTIDVDYSLCDMYALSLKVKKITIKSDDLSITMLVDAYSGVEGLCDLTFGAGTAIDYDGNEYNFDLDIQGFGSDVSFDGLKSIQLIFKFSPSQSDNENEIPMESLKELKFTSLYGVGLKDYDEKYDMWGTVYASGELSLSLTFDILGNGFTF